MEGKVSRILLATDLPSSEIVTAIPDPSSPPNSPTDIGDVFLGDVFQHPESGVAQRYKRLGISVRPGQKWKARLAVQGDILETLETTSTVARRVIRLTDKAGGD